MNTIPYSNIPITIKVRPDYLFDGTIHDDHGKVVITIDSELSYKEAAITLWHEWIHIFLFTGRKNYHDEDAIEFLAKNLENACPEILDLCGISHLFKSKPRTEEQLVLNLL